MPLIPMRDLLAVALAEEYAVGYFEAWDQYSLEAVLEAAEASRSPVILGFGGALMNQRWYDSGGLRRLAALGRATAESARVPVSLLLNEAATFEQITRGLSWGFNAVMLQTSELPFEENVITTRRVCAAAHAMSADVEGECSRLPDASRAVGDLRVFALSDPDEVVRYVAETGVDALSISIGNVHLLTDGEAQIRLDHLARLHQAVKVPFVVHGGTGFPDSAVARAIELGVAKFNVGTIMKRLYLEGIRDALTALPDEPNIQDAVGSRSAGDILQSGKERVKAEVMRRMAVYGAAGKA